MSVDQINLVLSALVFIGQIFIISALAYLVFFRKRSNKVIDFVVRNVTPFAFIVALAATSGSLYYSEIAGFVPCDLCWYQRIFMYPQVVLLGLAWWKKDRNIIDYSMALAALGLIISIYHNYVYYSARPTNFCSVTSCAQVYVVGFSYITIPLMALTGFVMIGLLLLLDKYKATR